MLITNINRPIIIYGFIFIICSIILKTQNAHAQHQTLPEEHSGIAADYPGDDGIAQDDRVIFTENFEAPSITSMTERWESVLRKDIMSFSPDTPEGSPGNQSLLFTHTGGDGTGGHLFRRLQPGHDQVFARFYVKFDQNAAPMHHFGAKLGGYNPSTPWPQGGAGEKPDGAKRFTSGVEPYGDLWRWGFYTYWHKMPVHGDGNYWGTPFFSGVAKPEVVKDQWICLEMMLKMNDPIEASNGEQAFWVDGKLWRVNDQIISHLGPGFPKGNWSGGWWYPDHESENKFEGFQWRTVEDLAINFLWTYVYITRAPDGHVSKVWFDDIVLANEYIGPISPMKSSVD